MHEELHVRPPSSAKCFACKGALESMRECVSADRCGMTLDRRTQLKYCGAVGWSTTRARSTLNP